MTEPRLTQSKLVDQVNHEIRKASAKLPWSHPVKSVQWIHIDRIKPNTYNPNSVPSEEMRLLYTSINSDGYTMPVVTVYDADQDCYVIVDGFHRYSTMLRNADIRETTSGYLPVTVINKPLADLMASTVRHNRARGAHSVAGMSQLVFSMLREGVSDEDVCARLGMEAEELIRLKHVTGYSKLYADKQYSQSQLTQAQARAKAVYKKAHPDEEVPAC